MEHVSSVIARVWDRFYMRSEQAAIDYCNEVVDGGGRLQYLDKVLSVSALPDPEAVLWLDDLKTDEQYRRFLNV